MIHSEVTDLYKIGYTSRLPERLKALQATSAYRLELTILLQCSSQLFAAAFERALHQQFAYCRTHGEWFKLEVEELQWIAEGVVAELNPIVLSGNKE